MVSFSLVAGALTGLIYHRPSGENSNFQFSSENSPNWGYITIMPTMMIMMAQFVKDEGLPVVLYGHPHMTLQYRNRISAIGTVCELRFGVLSKKRQLPYFCIT